MEQASTGLSFVECGIAAALKQRPLTVPLNQRPYAWTENEVQTLFDDLLKAFNEGDSIYFLGMIVLTQGPKGQSQVADGQQRLATISILIAAIRDYLLEIGEEKAATKYQEDYLLEYDPRSREYQAKLSLNYEDRDFIVTTILKPPKERKEYKGRKYSSHDRLLAAANISKETVKSVTVRFTKPQDKFEHLIDLTEFLHDQAKVIVIMVPGYVGNAYKMFETLNARGLRASQIDILKNYIFDKGKNKLGDIQPLWASMLSTIESLGEDDLLITYIRHYWITHNGPTTERELGDKIERVITNERLAIDMVKSLDSFAIDYVALQTPRENSQFNKFSHDTRNCIYTITRELRVEQILPLLLAITRYFSPKEAEKAFNHCLSWSVRFLIAGGGGGGVLDRNYGLRAKEISKGEIKTTRALIQKMASVVPNDQVFKSSFEIATVSRANLVRYYLRTINLHLQGEKKPQFIPSEDTTAVNAEHILPVTPSTEWKIAPDILASYYKRLGNIVLLSSSDNVKIGNKSFKEKKKIFEKSPFIATKWVLKYNKWGPEEITAQQKKLAELAPKVWPI